MIINNLTARSNILRRDHILLDTLRNNAAAAAYVFEAALPRI